MYCWSLVLFFVLPVYSTNNFFVNTDSADNVKSIIDNFFKSGVKQVNLFVPDDSQLSSTDKKIKKKILNRLFTRDEKPRKTSGKYKIPSKISLLNQDDTWLIASTITGSNDLLIEIKNLSEPIYMNYYLIFVGYILCFIVLIYDLIEIKIINNVFAKRKARKHTIKFRTRKVRRQK